MTKDFNVSPSDLQAGDTVEYKITIEHATVNAKESTIPAAQQMHMTLCLRM